MVQRAKSAQIAEKAVQLVEEIINDANWQSNQLHHDFGIDLHVKVFESTESRKATPWEFHIQTKGTGHLRLSKNHICFSIDREHLIDWYESPLPVLFVICDVTQKKPYWLWIKDYMEKGINPNWRRQKSTTLRIPVVNQLSTPALLSLLVDLKRRAFAHEAQNVITLVERSFTEEYDSPRTYPNNSYYQPLPEPDASIQNLALAKCILCQNYFWIDESTTAGWDDFPDGDGVPANCMFAKIYFPWGHQPAVYSCDAPEMQCPFCLSGRGPLEKCANCEKYHLPPGEDLKDEWDDDLIPWAEAKQLCADCLDTRRTS